MRRARSWMITREGCNRSLKTAGVRSTGGETALPDQGVARIGRLIAEHLASLKIEASRVARTWRRQRITP